MPRNNMVKVFLLLALAFGALASCPSYGCGNKNLFAENQCVVADEDTDTLSINPCKGDLVCNATDAIDDFFCVTQTESLAANNTLYPGEKCKYSAQCMNSLTCNNVCVGLALGADCFDSKVCAPGLRCDPDQGVCAATLSIGQTGCFNEFDCSNAAGCNKNSTASTGTCVAYYSLNPGMNVSNCNDDTKSSNLCASGSCEVYSPLGTEGYCVPGFVSPSKPKACSLDTDCVGSNSQNNQVNGTCSCGYNEYGNSYCDLFTGDADYVTYIKYLVKYFSSAKVNSVCNVKARFNDDCKSQALSEDLYLLLKQYELASGFYPEIQLNDACVKATYQSLYWTLYYGNADSDDSDDDDDSGLVLAMAALAYLV